MRFAPIILLLGILFNLACVIVFRLRLDRKYRDQLEEYKQSLSSDVHSMSVDALTAIDGYFVSNYHASATSPRPLSPEPRTFIDSGDWFFGYFEHNGIRYARVGVRNYREGDSFPRGGFITSIHPDGVLVDGEYWFRNSSSSSSLPKSSFSNLSKITQTNKGGVLK